MRKPLLTYLLVPALLVLFLFSSCTTPKTVFYAFADLPYKEKEVRKLENGVEDINRGQEHEFSIHLGDIKAGKTPCSPEAYTLVSEILERLNQPTFIIPGDNEWTDCSDRDSAWMLWEEHFMAFEQNWAGHPFETLRQPSRPENFAFVHRRCLFIGLNLVGGKVRDEAEQKRRQADNAEWMQRNFDAHQDKVKCAIVFGHAQPVIDKEDPNQPFFDALKDIAWSFEKPVLYMHGDGHELEMERFLAPNLLRLELNGGKESDWLMKVVVEPGKQQPFTFQLPVPEPDSFGNPDNISSVKKKIP